MALPAAREGSDDAVLPFAVETLDVRGRAVRLAASADAIIARHAYPPTVARVVGEAMALTVLLGASLKDVGRFQVQTRTTGPIDMIVIDFDAPGKLRAYARFDAAAIVNAEARGETDTGSLLGNGHLAMTIEQGARAARYQGVVAMDGDGFEAAAHRYFLQSEQIPTRVRLAVGEVVEAGADGHTRRGWRAGGAMVQFLPTSPERMRLADLDPGDAPEGHVAHAVAEDDAWATARALFDTIEDHELLDPMVGSERLLYRLFHEQGVRVFPQQDVVEACTCSRERIVSMLQGFGEAERRDMIGNDGKIGVTCEFCARHYVVDPAEAEPEG